LDQNLNVYSTMIKHVIVLIVFNVG